MRVRVWFIGLVIALPLLAGQAVTLGAKEAGSGNDEIYKELELFEHALAIVRSDYVEQPIAKELIYGALKVIASSS